MGRRTLAIRICALAVVVGVIGWLVWGSPILGFAALGGVLVLAVAFIVWDGPAAMYGPVRDSVRAGDDLPRA